MINLVVKPNQFSGKKYEFFLPHYQLTLFLVFGRAID